MENKNIYQLGALITIIILGIIRMNDSTNFPFMIFINVFSLLVTLLFLIYACKEKINKKKLLRPTTKNNLDLITVILVIVGLPTIIYLSYYKVISLYVADFLSMLALGISIAIDALSSIIVQEGKKN